MDRHSLSDEDLVEHLSNFIVGGETTAIKVRAAEIALKLKGYLQNKQEVGNVHVNIVIQDSEFGGANPILVPR